MSDSVGELLKTRRVALRLSLRHVAREAGISPSYLVALEQGRNPTTGRPPMPSPRVLMALGRALGIGRATLLELAAPPGGSAHLLVYQTGATPASPTEAARRVFGDAVDGWLEVVDTDAPTDHAATSDILLRVAGPLGGRPGSRQPYAPDRALAGLEALLADHRELASTPRLGLIFGARSRGRRGGDMTPLLESEATWESDVADLCRRMLGAEPVANVCVYRASEIRRRGGRPDRLTSALELIRAHPVVAVQGPGGSVTTGRAAIEAMLLGVAPTGTSVDAWRAVARAAAVGLAGDAGLEGALGERP